MPNCLNCHTPFSEEQNFCSHCSQKTKISKLSFWTIVKDFFSNLFNLDNKIWQTLKDIWIPGKLAKAYIEGKRAQYYHPLRIFLVVLFAFFTLFILRISEQIKDVDEFSVAQKEAIVKEDLEIKFDSLKRLSSFDSISINAFQKELFFEEISILEDFDLRPLNTTSKAILNDIVDDNDIIDSLRILELIDSLKSNESSIIQYSIGESDSTSSTILNSRKRGNQMLFNNVSLNDFYRMSAEEVSEMHGKGIWYKELFYSQVHKIVNNLNSSITFILSNGTWNIVAIILMMALFFKLLYIRHTYLFAEHFIFHVYGHTRLLLMAIISMLTLQYLIESFWLFIWFFAGLFYLYKGMRNYYQQSRIKTLFKFVLVNFAYFFCLLICSLIVMSISFFFL